MLTLAYARAAIAAQKQNKVTAQRVTALLRDYNNTATIANVTQVTKVALAAAHKDVLIQKVTRASVLMFANRLNYVAAVQRSAKKVDGNDETNVAEFEASEASFTHDADCYTIVRNKVSGQEYMYLHYNSAKSVYVKDNEIVTEEEVAAYCTKGAAAKMLQKDNTVYNKKNDVTHTICVRTVKLENIVRVAALQQVLV